MAKKIGVPAALKTFKERTGGYENFQYNTVTPQNNNMDFMLDEEEAEQMLSDANDFLQKYCRSTASRRIAPSGSWIT